MFRFVSKWSNKIHDLTNLFKVFKNRVYNIFVKLKII